jgi:hypothetical protein
MRQFALIVILFLSASAQYCRAGLVTLNLSGTLDSGAFSGSFSFTDSTITDEAFAWNVESRFHLDAASEFTLPPLAAAASVEPVFVDVFPVHVNAVEFFIGGGFSFSGPEAALATSANATLFIGDPGTTLASGPQDLQSPSLGLLQFDAASGQQLLFSDQGNITALTVTTAVPEPSSLTLITSAMLSILVGCCFPRRRTSSF